MLKMILKLVDLLLTVTFILFVAAALSDYLLDTHHVRELISAGNRTVDAIGMKFEKMIL